MGPQRPKWQKFLYWYAPIAAVVIILAGVQQFAPGGIRGLVRDWFIELSSTPAADKLSDQMVASLAPVGAAAICLEEHGGNENIKDAVIGYNKRNQTAMLKLVASIKAAGGMSNSEKDLTDRKAYRQARKLLGSNADLACK